MTFNKRFSQKKWYWTPDFYWVPEMELEAYAPSNPFTKLHFYKVLKPEDFFLRER